MKSLWSPALASAWFYWRQHVAVALSMAATIAVLVGALVVGSSMRGSLRALTLTRLQHIDEMLIGEHFFSRDVQRRLVEIPSWSEFYKQAEPAIFFPAATVETSGTPRRMASGVTVLGVEPSFWQLAASEPPQAEQLVGENVLVNQALAEDLGLADADFASRSASVTVRIPKPSLLPSDSALGHKQDLLENLVRLPVVGIVPDESLGRLAIHPSPEKPRIIYLPLDFLQAELLNSSLAHRLGTDPINVIFLSGRDRLPPLKANRELIQVLRLDPADLGLTLKKVEQSYRIAGLPPETVASYWSLTTERLIFRDELSGLLTQRLPQAQPVLTYLVNRMSVVTPRSEPSDPTDPDLQRPADDSGIPYSMVAGMEFNEQFSPEMLDGAARKQPLADDEIVLNEWAIANLGAQMGDRIRLTYYLPESTHGELSEQSVELRLVGGARLVEPIEPFRYRRRGQLVRAVFDRPPTLANDPDLTPEVPGLTDSESIERWDLPFSTVERIRPADDEYWNNHRTTPKGFISLARARQLWGSRFGETTGFRIPATIESEQIEQILNEIWRERPERLGLRWVRLKEQGLLASSGATPFDLLFLGLSSFVIGAALILLWLLFRLQLEQRGEQLGLLMAVGIKPSRMMVLYAMESTAVTFAGGLVGTVLGMAYAAGVIWLLQTWWAGALGRLQLHLHLELSAVVIGLVVGVIICILTIMASIWRAQHRPARALLAGRWESTGGGVPSRAWPPLTGAVACAAAAISLAILAGQWRGEQQALAFLGAGFLILLALISGLLGAMNLADRRAEPVCRSLVALATGNLRRHRLRSLLSIGMMAAATFLIVALSAFRLRPSDDSLGGMGWVAETVQPLFANLNHVAGQQELLGREFVLPETVRIYAWRLKPGEDASCTNPYQSSQPRVLGATDEWIQRFDAGDVPRFHWSATAARSADERRNPWRMLHRDDQPIPCIIDKNTAVYSLKIYSIGQVFTVHYDSGESVAFRLVGMLEHSMLQGSIIIGERAFARTFPAVSGYRHFTVAAGPDADAAVTVLRERLSDQGFSARRSEDILQQLMAVQNTYLSAFQTLGALGLLLGTFGLAAIQWRSVVERRHELALMRAIGYSPPRLAGLMVLEQISLLLAGLVMGIVAAAVTTFPHLAGGGAATPWATLALVLIVIFLIGSALGLGSAWWVQRDHLVATLRSG